MSCCMGRSVGCDEEVGANVCGDFLDARVLPPLSELEVADVTREVAVEQGAYHGRDDRVIDLAHGRGLIMQQGEIER